MHFWPVKKLKAGVEITRDQIRTALMFKDGGSPCIKELMEYDLIPQVLKPSFKTENIIDGHAFQQTLKKCCSDIPTRKISVALPDGCLKVQIKMYPELPDSFRETDEMILWDFSNSMNIPADDLRVSWLNMGKTPEGQHVFLTALGLKPVIVQYEESFKQAGAKPVVIIPAGLGQFNFYCSKITENGTVAYLGMFDDFVNIFVFIDGLPFFYKTIKKGLLGDQSSSAIDDVDLLIQYYNTENPDLSIEHFFVASHIKSRSQVEQILCEKGNAGFDIIDERELVSFDKGFMLQPGNRELPFYAGVLGAAQGE